MLMCTGLPFCVQESSGSFYAHKLFQSLPPLQPHFTDRKPWHREGKWLGQSIKPGAVSEPRGSPLPPAPRSEYMMGPVAARLMCNDLSAGGDHRFCSEDILAGGRDLSEDR